MATYYGRLPTMYGTMYATYCWHNVWLPRCPTLITLFEENQLVAISSNIKVHDSLQDHRKFISSLLLLFQLSVRSLWCTCHWDVRIGMDESRVGHQCDQIWANFATLVNFCSRWPNILSSFSDWQFMNLLWKFFYVPYMTIFHWCKYQLFLCIYKQSSLFLLKNNHLNKRK